MKEQERSPGRTVSRLDIQAAKKRCEVAKGIRMCGLSVEGGGDELERLETFIRHARSDLPAALEALEEAQGKLGAAEQLASEAACLGCMEKMDEACTDDGCNWARQFLRTLGESE